MAEVVAETGGVDDVRITAEVAGEFTPDLGDLERMSEPGAHEIIRSRRHDLSLGAEASKTGRVKDPGAITLKC
ncbi:hypothetical protein GCM10009691_14030 [Brevibacterium picturae]|uniref:Uncharacterized protein n=1 Tax=Brevibacterium picturae TaxID=260553 RepID=A0ABN2BJD4_9MICO